MRCKGPRAGDQCVKRVIRCKLISSGVREARDPAHGISQCERQKRVKRVIGYPPLFPARPLKRNSQECPSLEARRLRVADHALHALYAPEVVR